MSNIILDLKVRNHPGVMSQITGLFSRRRFNLEAILCSALNGGEISRMFLLVKDDDRLTQIISQVRKLYDVLEIELHGEDKPEYGRLEALLSMAASDCVE